MGNNQLYMKEQLNLAHRDIKPQNVLIFENNIFKLADFGEAKEIENMKNFNFTFIPLILGIFNIEICGESKVVILYRNPLYFSNFTHFNHWINFYITRKVESFSFTKRCNRYKSNRNKK